MSNHARENGGKKRPDIGARPNLGEGAMFLLWCFGVARSNIIDISDDSGTHVLKSLCGFPPTPNDRLCIKF